MPPPKKKPATASRWRRARAHVNAHPKAWAGGIFGSFLILWPVFTQGWPWVERAAAYFQSKAAAQAEYDKLRAELKVNQVRDLWQNVGIARGEERTLRYIFRKECTGPGGEGQRRLLCRKADRTRAGGATAETDAR